MCTPRMTLRALACLLALTPATCDDPEACKSEDTVDADGAEVTTIDLELDGVPNITIRRAGARTTIDHDLNQDGVPDVKVLAEDSDGDGAVDIHRTTVCAGGKATIEMTLVDLDGDGKYDVSTLKIDTDGDGTLDYEEHRRDTNGDGTPDELFDPLGG